jgi:para-nitrobenzyl esterase
MKKHYLLAITVLAFQGLTIAQTPCDAGRYSTEIFSTVDVTSNINFGQNLTWDSNVENLDLDFYEPNGDTETKRPLIIWAHGGSFIGGTKVDPDVVELSNRFAKRGYACASIDYRVFFFPFDSVNAVKAVVRAVQDMKAAIRFFYKDAATTDFYGIDTNKIFIGGSSAGAVTALHAAYFDKECEIENYMTIAELNTLGGIEGTSGNPGYSSNVQGVISLAGALASYGYLEAGDVPVCSLHGDDDGTVPYGRDYASVSGIPMLYMDGSRMIDEQAAAIGVQSNLYTHYGAGHAPYATSAAYMDTTVNFVRDFLIDLLGCTETPLQVANTPSGPADLYTIPFCGLDVNDAKVDLIDSPFPNPSTDQITINLKENISVESIEIVDLSGRSVSILDPSLSSHLIRKNTVGSGTYMLRVIASNGQISTSKIIFN